MITSRQRYRFSSLLMLLNCILILIPSQLIATLTYAAVHDIRILDKPIHEHANQFNPTTNVTVTTTTLLNSAPHHVAVTLANEFFNSASCGSQGHSLAIVPSCALYPSFKEQCSNRSCWFLCCCAVPVLFLVAKRVYPLAKVTCFRSLRSGCWFICSLDVLGSALHAYELKFSGSFRNTNSMPKRNYFLDLTAILGATMSNSHATEFRQFMYHMP